MSSGTPAVGIDLGMKDSCVGVWHRGRVEIVANDQGNHITPSFVSFSEYERIVGDAALSYADLNPCNTIYDTKRLIGRRFSDLSVQNDMKLWPFTVVSGPNDKPKYMVKYKGEEKSFYPEEISAMVLAKVKETAEAFLNCTVQNAVITVPAYFNASQRRLTRDAGTIAGFNVLQIMDEPIAAVVAYDEMHYLTRKSYQQQQYVLVFDLGQGTFDVTVVSIDNGKYEVKATAGDTHLGEEDFIMTMTNYFMELFKTKYRLKEFVSGDTRALRRLKDACQRVKRELLLQTHVRIEVDSLYDGIDFSFLISQGRLFDDLNVHLYMRCMDLVVECIKDAKIEKQSIDFVVLVGESTRIPKIRNLLQEYFQGKESCVTNNLDEVIAYGATIQASKLNHKTENLSPMDVDEGEGSNTEHNNHPHQFTVSRIAPAPRGVQNINSSFEIEANDERGVLQHELSEAQKLMKELKAERDDARKEVEKMGVLQSQLSEAQKLIEQLSSERDDVRKEVEELCRLTEQQDPQSQCVRYCTEYSYSELQDATNNFHESFKLGEGGFGIVYKGILYNTTVAIKILKEGSKQGEKEFHQEIEILSKVRHPNLVTLIGACSENHALIYEYLPNGSLEDHLRCKNNTSPLSWQARVRIAFETCSALSFLHCSKPHGITHGDLKPDNILLDLNNVSKISDFGLCRQLNWTESASVPFQFTYNLKGTQFYVDPEYFSTGKITAEYDAYSFGIILLRLATCKEPMGIRNLVEEAKRKGKLKALVDASAGSWSFKEAEKMISLGIRCCDPNRKNRPDMSTEVWKELKCMMDVASASASSKAASSISWLTHLK